MLTRYYVIALLLAQLILPSLARSAELTIATFVTPKHGMSMWLERWAAELEKRSAGRLTFEILHGAQMGPPPKYYDLARNGQADITWVLHGATPGRFRLTEISNMPFLFCSAEQATRVLNDPDLRRDFLDRENRGVKVLLNFMHPPGQIHVNGEPVLAVDDLKGKALRPPSQSVGQLIGALGGKPVGLPPTAMAESLQKGTIDGTMIDYGGAGLAFSLGPFLTDTTEVYAYTSSFTLVMNPSSYARLDADLQQLIDESVSDVAAEVGTLWDELDVIGKQVLIDAGVKIHTLPADELDKLKSVGNELTQSYVASLVDDGLPAQEVLERIRELITATGPVGIGCE